MQSMYPNPTWVFSDHYREWHLCHGNASIGYVKRAPDGVHWLAYTWSQDYRRELVYHGCAGELQAAQRIVSRHV